MMQVFKPTVSSAVWAQFPEYRALSVNVLNYAPERAPLAPAIALPAWAAGHIESWREAYKRFGATPKKTPPSVEALFKRFEKNGALPVIDPLVDCYNALSLSFGAPFGGEDLDRYVGSPQLVLANGSEPFDTSKDGAPVNEHPEPGEVVWRDDAGVTCRRWNWRQCKRTALTAQARNLWFVIDRLPPMPLDALQNAGEALAAALRAASPDCVCTVTLLEPGQ